MSIQLIDVGQMDIVPCMVVRQPRNYKEQKKVIRELTRNCAKFNALEHEFLTRLFSENDWGYRELYREYAKKWGLLITSRRVSFAYTEAKPDYFTNNYAPLA